MGDASTASSQRTEEAARELGFNVCDPVFSHLEKGILDRTKELKSVLHIASRLQLQYGITKMKADLLDKVSSARVTPEGTDKGIESVKEWTLMPITDQEAEFKRQSCEAISEKLHAEITQLHATIKNLFERMNSSIRSAIIPYEESYRKERRKDVKKAIELQANEIAERLESEKSAIYDKEIPAQCAGVDILVKERVTEKMLQANQKMKDKLDLKIKQTLEVEGNRVQKELKEKLHILLEEKQEELDKKCTYHTDILRADALEYDEFVMKELEQMSEIGRENESEADRRERFNAMMGKLEEKMRQRKREDVDLKLEHEIKEFDNKLKVKRLELMLFGDCNTDDVDVLLLGKKL